MSTKSDNQTQQEPSYSSMGTSLGVVFGGALGLVIWLTTDTFVFFPVFIGAGLTIGLAVGAERDKMKKG